MSVDNRISALEKYVNWKLISIIEFVTHFEHILDNDIKQNLKFLEKVNEEYNKVKDVSSKDMDLDEIEKLKDEDEELYKKISTRNGTQIRKIIVEYNIKYSENVFKDLGLNAAFLMSYSFFEESLSRICDVTAKMKNVEIKWTALKGSTLEAIKVYLLKVLHLQYDFSQDTNWDSIHMYQKIRNYITHSGNIIDDVEFQAIKKIIDNFEHIFIEDGIIFIKKDFIVDSLFVYEAFFKSLFKSIKKAI